MLQLIFERFRYIIMRVQKERCWTPTRKQERPVMIHSICRASRVAFLLGALLIGGFCIEVSSRPGSPLWAGSSSEPGTGKRPGDAERGRQIFNGKGICSSCHGIDGYRGRRPPLTPNTIEALAHLDPSPANLRDPDSLKLTTDKARFAAIRDGHLRTAMFPDRTLTDEEIIDTVAYLATLRGEQASPRKP